MEDSWCIEGNVNKDRGWGVMAFEGADKITPQRNSILKNKLINQGLVCMSGGNIYVFLTTLNYWVVLCSGQTIVYINNIIGIENATVAYSGAAAPYIPFIERECSDNIAKDIPQSVCIGTERLRVSLTKSGLSLFRCEPIVDCAPSKKGIMSSLCYMPIHIKFWPNEWRRTPHYDTYKLIAPLFQDHRELKTLEWCLGNAMIDPHSFSKTVILYGEGGHGKGTILDAVDSTFTGCCGTIPESALEGIGSGVPYGISSVVASNRVVISGDVGGANRNTNLSVIKALTGHDYIVVPPSRVKTACTLLYATNLLDDPTRNPEWCTPAIMRRVVVILINSKIMDEFHDRIPYDPPSRLDFYLRCVHTRLSNPSMPVSPISVLLTIMGSRFEGVSKYLTEGDADETDMFTANSIVAGALSLDVGRVGELAKRISRDCVVQISGINYIKDIVPTPHYYSTLSE